MNKEHLSTLSHLRERIELITTKPGTLRTDDLKLVYDFASKLSSKEYLGGLVQGIVLFGSVIREEATKDSDLDVLVIIDDVSNDITSEIASAYSLTVGSLLAKLNAHDKIHLTTLGIVRFWDGVRNGDPVIMSIIRSGRAIVDTGFFTPLKAMLDKGMIKPTREAVVAHLRLAESLMRNQVNYFQRSVADFYWAVMDAAHSLIMHAGFETTHPKETPKVFIKACNKLGVDSGISETIALFTGLMKSASKGGRLSFTGKQVDAYRLKAERFIKVVRKAVDKV